MSTHDTEICGFLDVKSPSSKYITQKIRKKTLPLSKVWKRFWCTVKKLEPGLGVRLQFSTKLSYCSSALRQGEKGGFGGNSVIIPPDAVVYRIRSKTKRFAFGISPGKDRRPLVSLSANSETEAQRWMANIRQLLKSRRYCSKERSYDVSMVDNAHSKAAGLTGLHGDLTASKAGIVIKNASTAETVETFKWKEFSQFHLMTAGRPEDVKRVCVIHTTKEFRCGIGELHVFCLEANKLLQDLVTQGRGPRHRQESLNSNEKNLEMLTQSDKTNRPLLQPSSDPPLRILNTETNCKGNIYQSDLMHKEEINSCNRKPNISRVSEIYEEIMDDFSKSKAFSSNVYENINKIPCNQQMEPPPLPPRQSQKEECVHKERANTGHFHAEISNFDTKLQNIEACSQETTLMDNTSYVLMSPQMRGSNISESDAEKENAYVIMG